MTQEVTKCTECESAYFKESSEMAGLCPECAHRLYGYKNCRHVFENGRCKNGYWDGRASDFLNNPD